MRIIRLIPLALSGLSLHVLFTPSLVFLVQDVFVVLWWIFFPFNEFLQSMMMKIKNLLVTVRVSWRHHLGQWCAYPRIAYARIPLWPFLLDYRYGYSSALWCSFVLPLSYHDYNSVIPLFLISFQSSGFRKWSFFCYAVMEISCRESGEPSKRKPYLPAEKQFLITRNGKEGLHSSLLSLITFKSTAAVSFFLATSL